MDETRIFKYVLQPDRRQLVLMPADARPLHVANQNDNLVMWVEVPQAHKSYVHRVFVVVTTGDRFNPEGKTYVGSAELGKWFVAHVYEQLEGYPDPIDTRVPEDWAQIKAETPTSI